jgi:hypothetical protein
MKLMIRSIAISFMAIVFFLGGCASKPTDPQVTIKDNVQVMRDAIIKVVADNDRKQKLLVLSSSLESTLLSYNQAYSEFAKEFGKLNRIYNTPRKKLEDLLSSFSQTRESAMNKVAKIHFDMVAQTSADEWKKIVKKELEAIKSVRQLPEDQLGS